MWTTPVHLQVNGLRRIGIHPLREGEVLRDGIMKHCGGQMRRAHGIIGWMQRGGLPRSGSRACAVSVALEAVDHHIDEAEIELLAKVQEETCRLPDPSTRMSLQQPRGSTTAQDMIGLHLR